MNVLRLVLVGSNVGPGLFIIAELLGKDEVVKRIDNGIKEIKDLNNEHRLTIL